jgi:hypothetical protein
VRDHRNREMSSTTIVFACKSNSCRSQMAEAWAREWIKTQRAELLLLGDDGGDGRRRRDDDDGEHKDGHHDKDVNENDRIRAFLDGIYVASVSLDESAAISPPIDHQQQQQRRLLLQQRHNLTGELSPTNVGGYDTNHRGGGCITCVGEEEGACDLVAPHYSSRRPPKEKAIIAMAHDGVDISDLSTYHAKSFREVLPSIIEHRRKSFLQRRRSRRHGGGETGGMRRGEGVGVDSRTASQTSSLLRRILENASREMGMAFAGIPREVDVVSDDDDNEEDDDVNDDDYNIDDDIVLDNFIVLCSCPDSIVRRRLEDVSATTLEWDIDPPSASARGNEGDAAYLRVSRRIRVNVHRFMDGLKGRAMSTRQRDDDDDNFGDNMSLSRDFIT